MRGASEIQEIVRCTANGFRETAEKPQVRITASAFDLCQYGQRDAYAGG
jgi:hypothetical protein